MRLPHVPPPGGGGAPPNRKTAKARMNLTGIAIAAASLVVIGAFHPIVIKAEYHTGTRLWWAFLLLGLACLAGALLTPDDTLSAIAGIVGGSALWSIRELFEQRKRVERGWFPRKPGRKDKASTSGRHP